MLDAAAATAFAISPMRFDRCLMPRALIIADIFLHAYYYFIFRAMIAIAAIRYAMISMSLMPPFFSMIMLTPLPLRCRCLFIISIDIDIISLRSC